MLFKDRADAGRKLLVALYKLKELKKNKRQILVVSLLRGGIILGEKIAQGLQVKHLPLAVAKIPAPHNPELALGALCFELTYFEKNVVSSLSLTKTELTKQISIAETKFDSYLKRFNLKKIQYAKRVKNKTVILTDDGIATGSTIKAAALYLKSKKPKKLILAVPVAPAGISLKEFDKEIILHQDFSLGAVSQFYQHFSQLENTEVKKFFRD